MRGVSTLLLVALIFAAVPTTVHSDDDEFATDMSLVRNDLRTEYRKLSRELRDVEDAIEAQEGNTTTISGRAIMVWSVRESLRDDLRKLSARRGELRARCKEIERDFRQLTGKVSAHYGETPVWWGDLE
jgi:hypothetical protein